MRKRHTGRGKPEHGPVLGVCRTHSDHAGAHREGKVTFRLVLSDGSSAVVAALSESDARGIVTEALRDEPIDRGIEVVRVEASDDPRRPLGDPTGRKH